MMRFFGNKQKSSKHPKDTQSTAEDRYYPTPIHSQYATHTTGRSANVTSLYPNSHFHDNVRQSPSDDQSWNVVPTGDDSSQFRIIAPSRSSTLPAGTPPPSPPRLRSPSPYSHVSSNPSNKPSSVKDRDMGHRKKPNQTAPVALGILKALDATRQMEPSNFQSSQTNLELSSDNGHWDREKEAPDKKERRGFWNHSKERSSKDRGKEKDHKDDAALTRLIGHLAVTASEDWMLVLEACDRASSGETSAKEAVRALRRELKYSEPSAQLSAARLWAIMSRNCSDAFVMETTGRKFITTLEDLMTSPRTSPVVRERLLIVIAAAAYNSSKDSNFRILWRKFKPSDKPEEGIPFDADDEMINPPTSIRQKQIDSTGFSVYPSIPTPAVDANVPARKRLSPPRDRIIPLEEDIQRLFQECHVGTGNASLLSDALAACKPERLKKDPVIKEFLKKCRTSQELIYAQIPWATAGAERSRAARSQTNQRLRQTDDPDTDDDEQTTEERLLGQLLNANEELLFVLRQYDDLERVALERKLTRMDPRNADLWRPPDDPQNLDRTASSRSPSPSIRSSTPPRPLQAHQSRSQTSLEIQGQLLAPPPPPHGPRSPQPAVNSRTPSNALTHDQRYPTDPKTTRGTNDLIQNAVVNVQSDGDDNQAPLSAASETHDENTTNMDHTTPRPSAKALGKRKLVERTSSRPDFDTHKSNAEPLSSNDNRNDSESDEDDRYAWLHPPVNYVYDAAAERTQQRMRDAAATLVVNGVH